MLGALTPEACPPIEVLMRLLRSPHLSLHRPIAVLALLGLFAVLAGCGDDDGESSDGTGDVDDGQPTSSLVPQSGGTLSWGVAIESIGWQPAASLWDPSGYVVASSFFDRLTQYDANGDIRPYLAEAIEPNDDFTEWTITLREGVEFHDGTALDAEALQIHFENMMASLIWGPSLATVESVEVVDPRHLVAHMNKPFSTFPHLLSAQPGFVAAPSQYADADGARNPVGTGPFIFEEWIEGDTLTVRANPDYWREGYPLLESIQYKVIPDSGARRTALQEGDLDLMEVNAADDIADLEESGDYTVFLDSEGENTEMTAMLNSGRLPFEDPDARLAVALGLDKQAIADEVYAGRFDVADGPFRDGSPWFQGVEFPAYDPDRARELAEGYEADHGSPIEFTIEISQDPFELKVAQEIERQLEELGIGVEVSAVPAVQTTIDVAVGHFDMNVTNLLWGSQHPDREYFTLHSSNALPIDEIALGITRMRNETIDEALDAARTTDDPSDQVRSWATVQEQLAIENTFIFLVHNEVGEIVANRVHDLTNWTFPDGTPGRPQEQTIVSPYQLWIDQ
jgi:peptide/nickel transport system substrate-binding protein